MSFVLIGTPHPRAVASRLRARATDPVCRVAVETGDGPHHDHRGTTWWFCSTHCRDELAAAPQRFLPLTPGDHLRQPG